MYSIHCIHCIHLWLRSLCACACESHPCMLPLINSKPSHQTPLIGPFKEAKKLGFHLLTMKKKIKQTLVIFSLMFDTTEWEGDSEPSLNSQAHISHQMQELLDIVATVVSADRVHIWPPRILVWVVLLHKIFYDILLHPKVIIPNKQDKTEAE